MDRSKSKRRSFNHKTVNKKNNLLVKLQKIIKKREKGKQGVIRGENSVKKPNSTLRRHNPKECRMRKGVRGRQAPEGIFMKGLRTEYVTRGALNEANEARKNEDINKIIDIGRIIVDERPNFWGNPLRVCQSVDSDREKLPTVFDLEDSLDTSHDFEQCSLSPISFALATNDQEQRQNIWKRNNTSGPTDWKTRKEMIQVNFPDFRMELKRFSLKYEETVGSQILEKLPKNGVLEDALKSLKEILRSAREESENEENGEFLNFLRGDLEPQFKEEVFPGQNEPINPGVEAFFGEAGLCNFLLDDYREQLSPLFPIFDSEDHFQDMCFAEQEDHARNCDDFGKELDISSPPIQFYRRNMF